MLWTREQDSSNDNRAMGIARLKAGLDAEVWPSAYVRTCRQRDGFGPERRST